MNFLFTFYKIWCREERQNTLKTKTKAPEPPKAESIQRDESINVEGKSINLDERNVENEKVLNKSINKSIKPVVGNVDEDSQITQRQHHKSDDDNVNEDSVHKKEQKPKQSSSKSTSVPERPSQGNSAYIR